MNKDEILSQYQKNGFAIIPNALTQEELNELNQLVDLDIEQNPGDWPEAFGARGNGQIIMKYPDLDRYVRHSKTFPIIQEIMRGEARFAQFDFRDVSANSAESSGMFYHRDIAFYAESGGKLWDPSNPYISSYTCIIYYLTDVNDCCPCFQIVPNSHPYDTFEKAKAALGDQFQEVPIRGPAGTAVLYNITTYHTRIAGDPDCKHGRRTMHNYHSRESYPPLTNFVLIPEPLGLSSDPETAMFYSKWNPRQINYAKENYRSDIPGYYYPLPDRKK